jgi:hypothetical protein
VLETKDLVGVQQVQGTQQQLRMVRGALCTLMQTFRINPVALLPPPPTTCLVCQVVLMDSLKKRTTFLERAVAHLGEAGHTWVRRGTPG